MTSSWRPAAAGRCTESTRHTPSGSPTGPASSSSPPVPAASLRLPPRAARSLPPPPPPQPPPQPQPQPQPPQQLPAAAVSAASTTSTAANVVATAAAAFPAPACCCSSPYSPLQHLTASADRHGKDAGPARGCGAWLVPGVSFTAFQCVFRCIALYFHCFSAGIRRFSRTSPRAVSTCTPFSGAAPSNLFSLLPSPPPFLFPSLFSSQLTAFNRTDSPGLCNGWSDRFQQHRT